MRAFSDEQVARGSCEPTLFCGLKLPQTLPLSAPILLSRSLSEHMTAHHTDYITTTEALNLIQRAVRIVQDLSPHEQDRCTTVFRADQLRELSVVLVHTPGRQARTDDAEPPCSTDGDLDRGQRSTQVAARVNELLRDNALTAERYVALVASSPDPALTRRALRVAQAGGAQVTSDLGPFLTRNDGSLPSEVASSEVHRVKVVMTRTDAHARFVWVQIVDAGRHFAFWNALDGDDIPLEVADPRDRNALMFAHIADMPLDIEMAVSILLPKGRTKSETVRASLVASPAIHEVAKRVIAMLSEQMTLLPGDEHGQAPIEL